MVSSESEVESVVSDDGGELPVVAEAKASAFEGEEEPASTPEPEPAEVEEASLAVPPADAVANDRPQTFLYSGALQALTVVLAVALCVLGTQKTNCGLLIGACLTNNAPRLSSRTDG